MIATSGNAAIFTGDDRNVAITPDGTRVVYVGGGGNRLYVRALDALEPTVIASGTGLRGPFISPDGEWVGYFDGDQQLMKVAITGGPPVRIIGRIDGSNSRGATWGRDGNILFATSLSATGLQRVSAAGGPVTVVTRPDRARGEGDHLSPHLLPDGRAVLFTITFQTSPESPTIAVLDLDTGAIKELVRGGADAWYVATGHLVYTASATLRAVPFDRRTMTVSGAPVPVLDRIATAGTVNAGSFAVSDEGTLIYVHEPNGASGPSLRTLVWLDRTGKVQVIPAPPHLYRNPRISPDGTRIAVGAEDQQRDIWIWDVRRAVLTPLTSDPNVDTFPVWTPDGSRIVFASGRDTNINLWWQPANGLGSAERLLKSANIQIPTAVTHDGRDVVFHEVTAERSADILKVPLVGPRKPEPLVATKALERDAVVSPDGRWLAFESNTSGNLEVVVRTLVAGAEGQWQVSTNGGMRPAWSRNELFYVGPDGSLMGIAVPPGSAAWAGSTPTKITRLPDVSASVDFNRDYDVSLDGQRIVAIKTEGDQQQMPQSTLVLVQHWDQDVASRVKAK
jgi:serine/threonine-protein kinase